MKRLALVLAALLVAAAPAAAQDPDAPPGAEKHWLPNEEWVNQLWLPFEEQRLYDALGKTRGEVFRWVRIDASNTLAQLGARKGLSAGQLAARLVAGVPTSRRPLLERRARRVVTQAHLGQHLLFHALHQTAVADNARKIFGVPSRRAFLLLRRAELSPLQIGELHGRSRVAMQRAVDGTLRAIAAKGVRRGAWTRAQADLQLERQLRQVPRWLGQKRYNGPSGGRNRLELPPGDVAKHPTLAADGGSLVWDAYRTTISEAERRGEIHVRGIDLADRRGRAISQPVKPGSRRPHSAYNSVLAADGRVVAFETAASTFPLAKRVGQMSVLVRDLRTGALEKISHAGRGAGAPTRTAFNPAISGDGRLVAYEAVDSATASTPQRAGLYVFDRAAGRERLVAEHGERGAAFLPRLSADGSTIAYTRADESGKTVIDVRDLASDRVTTVAAASDAYEPALSADGSVLAYTSRAGRLTVFVHDLRSGTTTAISKDADASEAALSADGRFVAYVGRLRFRGTSILGLRSRVWLHDRETGATALVSRRGGAAGGAANGFASEPSVSADGRRVAFASTAGNLSKRKPFGLTGVFVRDLTAGTTTLVSDHGTGAKAAARAAAADALLCPLDRLH